MHLILTEVDHPDRRTTVTEFPCLVGKAEDCRLRLIDKRLSDHHAAIVCVGGKVRVLDLASTNGTCVVHPDQIGAGGLEICPSVPSINELSETLCEAAPEVREGTQIAFAGVLFVCDVRADEACMPDGGVAAPVDCGQPSVEPDGGGAEKQPLEKVITLHVTSGPESGRTIVAKGDSVVLGSDVQQADIVFASHLVSRQHARLFRNQRGQVTLEDLRSKNGTFVNGRSVTDSIRVKAADEISLGHGTTFHVEGGHEACGRRGLFLAIAAGVMVVAVLVSKGRRMETDTSGVLLQSEPVVSNISAALPAPVVQVPLAPAPAPRTVLDDLEEQLSSGGAWQIQELSVIQHRLRSVDAAAASGKKEQLTRLIDLRIQSIRLFQLGIAAVQSGRFMDADEQFRLSVLRDAGNERSLAAQRILKTSQAVLTRIAAESVFDVADEPQLGALVRDVVEAAEGETSLCDAFKVFLTEHLGDRVLKHRLQSREAGEGRHYVDALLWARRAVLLLPWDEQAIAILADLESKAKPELEALLIQAYQLESHRTPESMADAAIIYQRLLEACSPTDWTGSFHAKAHSRTK